MQETKLSVIVAVYNVEKYLHQCLNSIIEQSYRNLEIILVDDGSTDHSAQICDEYAYKDSRIKVIHKDNGGAVSAKKRGIKEATGAIVTFVDSDDWLDTDMYEYLITEMQKNRVDIITSGFHMPACDLYDFFTPGVYDEESLQRNIFPNIIYNKEEWHGGIIGSACTKIYPTNLLREILVQMDEALRQWEDTCYVYLPFFQVKRIQITGKAFYHYRQNDNSVTHSFNKENWEQCKYSFHYIESTWKNRVPESVLNQLRYVQYWAYMTAIEQAINAKDYGTLEAYIWDPDGQKLLQYVDYRSSKLESKYKKMTLLIKEKKIQQLVAMYILAQREKKVRNYLRNVKRKIIKLQNGE